MIIFPDLEHKTRYCANTTANHLLPFAIVPTFCHDTLVFLAISYRLASNAVTDNSYRARLLSAITGKGLFKFSRSLIINGQIYYL